MASTGVLPSSSFNGASLSSFPTHHSTLLKYSVAYRSRGQALQVLANPYVSGVKAKAKEVIMVDPLEAKRLATKQMQKIKAKEKLKRQRQIEAINGAWAMLGLTAGLLIEGQTGKSIPSQLAGYWNAIVHFFMQ